jgi:single-stranded-DNA-specific exonuclease
VSAIAVPEAAPAPVAPPARRLALAACAPLAVEALREALGVSRTLAQVLVRRGLGEPAAARAFLAADEAHPPDAFEGIADATALILRHVRDGSRITVHGDYDVDGVCATALLVRALRRLVGSADVDHFLPSRIDDGYGLSLATVERLAARGTRLLVTVDCAITAVEEVAAARAAGLDVVVTDHHRPRADGVLPDAPIVHPALNGYPCPDLCAAGVALKLAQALDQAAGEDPRRAEQDLDLVALATIADLVPLRGENRRLVREGLRALASTGKPGLRALMHVAKVDPSGLDAGTVGFRLAPRINAAGRLYRADAGVELLLTEDEARAAAIAAELDAANAERRAVERQIGFDAEAQVRELGARHAYVLAGEGWHPGVIGIVASRIAERHHRPAILIAIDPDTGTGTGSGRSIPGFDLLEALNAAAPLLDRYGGHRAAAGLTIQADRIDELRAAIEQHAQETLTDDDLIPKERVDAVVGGAQLGLALADELAQLEPTGMGNPAVNLLVPGALLTDVKPMGEENRHARFTVQAGGTRCRAVSFNCDGRLPIPPTTPANATFRLERNHWNGAIEPRLLLRHTTPTTPPPITTLGEPTPTDWLKAVLTELRSPEAAGREPAGSATRGEGQERAPVAGASASGGALEPADDDRAGGVGELAPRTPLRSEGVRRRHSPTTGPARHTAGTRVVLDRRGEGGTAVLVDLLAGDGSVLAVCANVPRRLAGLSARVGGFALCSHQALARQTDLSKHFQHVVVLDPPTHPDEDTNMRQGNGLLHLTWGTAELRFAQQIHELEYGIRASLVPLYRALKELGSAAGDPLERLLRGDGRHGRSASHAARLVTVLEELGLVRLDRELPALRVLEAERTELERSATYRAAMQRHQEGLRFLARATSPRPSTSPPTGA